MKLLQTNPRRSEPFLYFFNCLWRISLFLEHALYRLLTFNTLVRYPFTTLSLPEIPKPVLTTQLLIFMYLRQTIRTDINDLRLIERFSTQRIRTMIIVFLCFSCLQHAIHLRIILNNKSAASLFIF
jgi:hypothetical protein